MTKITFAASATAILMATTALAGPVEDLVAQLEAEGYTNIEVEVDGAETEIEGVLNGMEREITVNSETGEILADETEAEDDDEDDNDEDDSDEDDNDDDEDESDEDEDEDEKDDA